ncbi:MAG TPA: sialidase family protein [Candidatus Nitrosotalea sp.]|nr:sialidase family protein [Candidatus Nitrosotalea sp.]
MKAQNLLILTGLIPICIIGMGEIHAQYGCPPVSGGWHPQISTDQNNVYVFWNYFYGCGTRVLLFEKSNDNGVTFGNPVTLEDPANSGSYPVVVASNGNVYVSGINYISPSERLFFKMSSDNGSSFTDAVEVNTNNTVQNDVSNILVSKNNIGIVWTGISNQGLRSVFLNTSTDGGKTFGNPVILTATTGDSYSPEAIQVGSKAYVLWSSIGNCNSARQECASQVYLTTMDIKNGFATDSITSLGQLDLPRLAVFGNNVYVAGITSTSTDPSVGNSGVSFMKSSDGGTSFEKPVQLVTYEAGSNYLNGLALDSSEDYVYITWVDHDPHSGEKLLMTASTDDGNTFGKIQTLEGPDVHYNGNEGPYSLDQQISVSGSKYYIIWQSHTPLDPNGQGIFFRKSTDGGQTLDDTTDMTNKIVISNPGYVIASNGNHIYIAGPEYAFKDGNHIVFSQSSDGGTTFSNSTDFDQNSISTVPEFPFAVPVMLIGLVASLVFYSVKLRR